MPFVRLVPVRVLFADRHLENRYVHTAQDKHTPHICEMEEEQTNREKIEFLMSFACNRIYDANKIEFFFSRFPRELGWVFGFL